MFIKFSVLFYLVNYARAFALPFEGLFKLDIIHYNDFHARFEETSVETPTCRYNNNSCLGGFPRLYSEVTTLLAEKPNAILLNAGDSFQGTYWYTLLKWNITQQFMNLMPHDAHAIGNHEFDDGPEGLAPYLASLKAPVVAANMDTSKEPTLQGLYKSHIIVKRHGRKIGIIGLVTPDTKKLSSAGNVEFTDPRLAARREADALCEKGVDIIILLSHCGLDVDKEIARDYGQNIDIIIGGHTHSLLWNGVAPSGEVVAGPYPIVEESNGKHKHPILIVQASAFTKYMGNLSLYFDIHGHYVKMEGGPIFLDRSIPEDPVIKSKLAPYALMVHEAENVTVGESETMLPFEECVYGECALGDLLTDSLVEFAKSEEFGQKNSQYEHMAFIQRGNIKSSILQGPITLGAIFELLPYNDGIETFELPGKYLKEALERSVSEAWGYNPFKGPWVLQVSGLQLTYNISKPEGQRLLSAYVGDQSSTKALNSESVYQVTAPAYLADGGDGFTMFKTGKRNMKTIGRDEKVLEDYIRKNSPLNVHTDGRIIIT